jgi:hypothetical protein
MKFLNYPHERYQADDMGLGVPSLNSSIAKMLVDTDYCPAHAKHKHPILGAAVDTPDDEEAPEDESQPKAHFDIGHAIHREILGRGADYVVCEYKNWATKAARAARDAVRADGKVPLLSHQHAKIVPAAQAVRRYMASEGLPPMDEWETEVVYTGTTRSGNPTRGMIDAWHPGLRIRLDLKSAEDLSLHAITRAVYWNGYAFQDEFYERLGEQNGDSADQRLILFVDKSPPFLHRLVRVDPFGSSIVSRQVDRAMEIWDQCIRDGFPTWQPGVIDVTPPESWVKQQMEYV